MPITQETKDALTAAKAGNDALKNTGDYAADRQARFNDTLITAINELVVIADAAAPPAGDTTAASTGTSSKSKASSKSTSKAAPVDQGSDDLEEADIVT